MKIEIVEFYPIIEKFKRAGQKIGYLHVYLCDFDIDLRGVAVKRKKGRHKVFLPAGLGAVHNTGEKVFYKIFQFCKPKSNEALIAEIELQIETFLGEWFAEHPELPHIAKRCGYAKSKKRA